MDWPQLRARLTAGTNPATKPPKLSIPPLPQTAVEFCRAADRPDVTVSELAGIIERDPALVIELLRLINSSASGVSSKVSSARAALALLGSRRAKMFVMTSSVNFATQRINSPLAKLGDFSFAANQRAAFARRLGERLSMDAELCYAGALLSDFALPAITSEYSERYRALREAITEEVSSLAEVEQRRNGWDHGLVAARLMESWQFPDDLVCLSLCHHRLDVIENSRVLGSCELLPVALAALLPDPLDSRATRMRRLEETLQTRFSVSVPEIQEQVRADLTSLSIPPHSRLSWRSAEAA